MYTKACAHTCTQTHICVHTHTHTLNVCLFYFKSWLSHIWRSHCFDLFWQDLIAWLRTTLNSWSSSLHLLGAGVTYVCHYTQHVLITKQAWESKVKIPQELERSWSQVMWSGLTKMGWVPRFPLDGSTSARVQHRRSSAALYWVRQELHPHHTIPEVAVILGNQGLSWLIWLSTCHT